MICGRAGVGQRTNTILIDGAVGVIEGNASGGAGMMVSFSETVVAVTVMTISVLDLTSRSIAAKAAQKEGNTQS
jgi:hypothetical protein